MFILSLRACAVLAELNAYMVLHFFPKTELRKWWWMSTTMTTLRRIVEAEIQAKQYRSSIRGVCNGRLLVRPKMECYDGGSEGFDRTPLRPGLL